MTENDLQTWLDELELDAEQKLMAGMALALARSFDESGNTSTAAELRKTILELKRMVTAGKVDVDPLAEMLTR